MSRESDLPLETSDAPRIGAIIPNWNGFQFTIACLESILGLDYPQGKLEVIVVDNGSTDHSVEQINLWWQQNRIRTEIKFQVLKAGANIGAPAAYNLGILNLRTDIDIIWKLDNDVVIPTDYLQILLRKSSILKDPQTVAVTGQVRRYDDFADETIGSRIYPTFKKWTRVVEPISVSQLISGAVQQVDLVMLHGASTLYVASVLASEKFDARFFLYYDDTELGIRLRRLGYHFEVILDTHVLHWSSKSTQSISATRIYFWARNQLLLGDIVFKGIPRIWYRIVQLLLIPWKFYRWVLVFGSSPRSTCAHYFLKGVWDFWRGKFGPMD